MHYAAGFLGKLKGLVPIKAVTAARLSKAVELEQKSWNARGGGPYSPRVQQVTRAKVKKPTILGQPLIIIDGVHLVHPFLWLLLITAVHLCGIQILTLPSSRASRH
jgi:hypothetical protein